MAEVMSDRQARGHRNVILPDFDSYHTFQTSFLTTRCAGCGWRKGNIIHDFAGRQPTRDPEAAKRLWTPQQLREAGI